MTGRVTLSAFALLALWAAAAPSSPTAEKHIAGVAPRRGMSLRRGNGAAAGGGGNREMRMSHSSRDWLRERYNGHRAASFVQSVGFAESAQRAVAAGLASPRALHRQLKVLTEGSRLVASSAHKPKLRRSGGLKTRRAAVSATNSSCSIDLKLEFSGITFDYICDVTDALLHNDGDGTRNWYAAQPASGCHQYVAYWNQDHAKPACSVGSPCSACSASSDLVKKTVHFQGGTCEPCGASPVQTVTATPAIVAASTTTTMAEPLPSAFDLADKNGDGVLSREEYFEGLYVAQQAMNFAQSQPSYAPPPQPSPNLPHGALLLIAVLNKVKAAEDDAALDKFVGMLRKWARERRPLRGRIFSPEEVELAIASVGFVTVPEQLETPVAPPAAEGIKEISEKAFTFEDARAAAQGAIAKEDAWKAAEETEIETKASALLAKAIAELEIEP